MRGKKKKNSWVMGMANESTYQVNGVTYNVNGKVTDNWFMRLSHKYEVEQEELKKQMFDLKNKIERLDTAQN